MSEFDALVKGVIAEPGGAGVLADWLQENGREREAVLLRRRWRIWQRQTDAAHHDPAPLVAVPLALAGAVYLGEHMSASQCTDVFREYIRARFAGRRVECVRVWLSRRDRAMSAHIPRAEPLPTPDHYETLCGWEVSRSHYGFLGSPVGGVCGRCRDLLVQTDTPLLDEVPK